MHRFYLSPDHTKSDSLILTDGEARHASQVLRLRAGETVTVLDGAGAEMVCEVRRCERNQVQLDVVTRKPATPPPCELTLIQAIPKGKIIESIIQKATELGVARIVPLLSARVVTRLDPAGAEEKRGKWQAVAIEAIKQCGAVWLPKVEAPVSPEEFLARGEKFDLPLIASLQPGSQHPRGYFTEYWSRHGRRPRSICIWIGPEGDFTPEEVAAIVAGGALPITMGPLVLRVETAATYGLAALNYELTAPIGA